eukprot:CCRYP_002110-RA/>CCRYP_002110-RA protein AED:0.51 eAED:0.17 QI:0/0/0/1/0/0/5/0/1273
MSTPTDTGGGGMSPVERVGLRLWRMLGVGTDEEIMDCIRDFQALSIRGRGAGSSTPSSSAASGAFSFEEVTPPAAVGGESSDLPAGLGEYAAGVDEFVVPPDTPSSVRNYWESPRVTRAVLVGEGHCRSKASEMGAMDWIICLSSPCDLLSHNEPRAIKMEVSGPTLVIEAPTASAATKRKGFNRPSIPVSAFPDTFQRSGGLARVQALRMNPMELRAFFLTYPGRDKMEILMRGGVATLQGGDGTEESMKPNQVHSTNPEEYQREEEAGPGYPEWENLGQDAFHSDLPASVASFPTYPTKAPQATATGRLVKQLSEVHERINKLEKRFDFKDLALSNTFRRVREYLDKEIANALAASREYAFELLDQGGYDYVATWSRQPADRPSQAGQPVTDEHLGIQQGGDALQSAIREQVEEELRREFDEKLAMKVRELEAKHQRDFEAFKRYCDTMDLGRRLQQVEDSFNDPKGVITVLENAVKGLQDQKSEMAVVRAQQVFKSESDVEAWASALGHREDMHKYVPDMVTILMLTNQPFATFEGAMAVYGSTAKANFSDLLEAQVKVSHEVIFPENVISVSTSKEAASVGGLRWSPQFMTAEIFEGDLRNGTIVRMKEDIYRVRDGFKATYGVTFPPDKNPIVHAILMEQLTEATVQAIGWLEEMQLPFYRALKAGGMGEKEAWTRVLVVNIEFFKDVRSVRSVTATPSAASMIYGSFRATDLIGEYVRCHFIQHPKIASTLVLTSMEREGKAAEAAAKEIKVERERINRLEHRVQQAEGAMNTLKQKNPSLQADREITALSAALGGDELIGELHGDLPIRLKPGTGEKDVIQSVRAIGRQGRGRVQVVVIGWPSLAWVEAAELWGASVEAFIVQKRNKDNVLTHQLFPTIPILTPPRLYPPVHNRDWSGALLATIDSSEDTSLVARCIDAWNPTHVILAVHGDTSRREANNLLPTRPAAYHEYNLVCRHDQFGGGEAQFKEPVYPADRVGPDISRALPHHCGLWVMAESVYSEEPVLRQLETHELNAIWDYAGKLWVHLGPERERCLLRARIRSPPAKMTRTIAVPKDFHGASLEEIGEDDRFHEARPGDHLCCPFQCPNCHSQNIKGRDLRREWIEDAAFECMVIRARIDAFWARQRGTVKSHVREVKNMRRMGRAMGFDPFPPLGPYPLGEHLGMMQATMMEMRGLDKGRKGGNVKFGSARGVRSTGTVLWESSPAGGGDLVLSSSSVKGRYVLSRNPTEARWFELFARGISKGRHSRTGQGLHSRSSSQTDQHV